MYAALDTQTGEVLGTTTPRHTSQEFVALLSDLVARQPEGQEIHIICDNLSAHKTNRVADFLDEHPNVELHFTPTYSSWLDQVELWFSKIERDLTYPRVFTPVGDLARRIMTYIRKYNDDPAPSNGSTLIQHAVSAPLNHHLLRATRSGTVIHRRSEA